MPKIAIFFFLTVILFQPKLYSQTKNPIQLKTTFHKNLLRELPSTSELVLSSLYFSQGETDKKASGNGNSFVIPAQLVIGTLGGFAIGLGAGLIAAPILPGVGTGGDHDIPASFIVGYVGYLYGTSYLVNSFGKMAGFKPSMKATLFGSLLGSLAGFYMYDSTDKGGGILLGPPIVATLAFHISQGALK